MGVGERLYRLRVRLVLARERNDQELARDLEGRILSLTRAAWL